MENKTLILDYSTWRCGNDGEQRLGEGATCLLNNEGYMCCLGQFTPQLNPDMDKALMADKFYPQFLHTEIPYITELIKGHYCDTTLARKAAGINDSNTTPEEKIEKLQELFTKEGFTIQVINKP